MSWKYPSDTFEEAWTHTLENAADVRGYPFCVCLGCRKRVHGGAVLFWTDYDDDGREVKLRTPQTSSTARCPHCNQPSVLSNQNNDFPILNPDFVEQMSDYVTERGYVERRNPRA